MIFAPTVFISAYIPAAPVFLSTLNPSSFEALSVQERSTCEVDTAAADNPEGGSGAGGGGVKVVAFA